MQQILRLDPTNSWAAEHEQILQQLIADPGATGRPHDRNTQEEGRFAGRPGGRHPLVRHRLSSPGTGGSRPSSARARASPAFGLGGGSPDPPGASRGPKDPAGPRHGDVAWESVLQQLEKNMGVSIRVKWKHLETLGYSAEGTKVGPVRLSRVTNEKALRVILEDASGPYVGDPNELSYVVDNGEITISTKQDLSRMVTMPEVLHVRVYDTRDILRGWAWATRSFRGMGGYRSPGPAPGPMRVPTRRRARHRDDGDGDRGRGERGAGRRTEQQAHCRDSHAVSIPVPGIPAARAGSPSGTTGWWSGRRRPITPPLPT